MKKYIVSIVTIIILVGLHFYMNPNPKKVIENHLKNKYNEEFVVELLGKRNKTYEAIIYPQKYVGTPKENDTYYWGRGFAKGRNGGDTYGLVLLNESTNEFFLPKLKELFGENVLPVFNMGPGYNKNNFKEELETMKKAYKEYPTANFEPISGGIYIFGRVESDKDREWYRKQIYEFVQFMKQTGTFEYVDLGIIVIDDRVLSKEFQENKYLKAKLVENGEKYWEKDRRYYNEVIRRELMNKELPKNVTPIINLEDINKSSMTNSLAWSNYNNLLTVSLYSPKYIENNYLDDEEKKEYNSINDLKFLDEEKRK
jgi:hypothetical protein